jgi:hypothetical protein
VARNRVVWSRRPPRRAAGRLAWTCFLALVICGPAWLLFGDEPADATGGAVNPLMLVVPALAVVFGLAMVPQVIGLVRRPVVSADHYALTVRPGAGRTLMLPWAQIAEVATMEIDEENFLLVRCQPISRRSGDWPRWWDQAHLRSAKRGAPAATAYDLAIPLDDFAGRPEQLLTQLTRFTPAHVTVASRAPR